MKIATSDTGYVGRSNAILVAHHNQVITLDIIPEKETTKAVFKIAETETTYG